MSHLSRNPVAARSVGVDLAGPDEASPVGVQPDASRMNVSLRRFIGAGLAVSIGAGLAGWLFGASHLVNAAETGASSANVLSEAERDAGWRLLFDGQTLAGWRGYKGQAAAASWKIVGGSLGSKPAAGEALGHLISNEQFGDFELRFDWKMVAGGNSGVMYRVTEAQQNPWDSGPEYQVLDNTKHPDGHNPLSSASACYAVYPPAKDASKPVGEWNEGRIVATGNRVEHWLNGEKVVQYEVGTPDFSAHLKTSRYWATPEWGRAARGHLCLQDYGSALEYRNIKVRVIDATKG